MTRFDEHNPLARAPRPEPDTSPWPLPDPLWVFGYGSLLWSPGFDWSERQVADLPDHHRSFCMWSVHHRGRPEAPGLVLALDPRPGARCTGMAFAVPGSAAVATLAALRARELISSAYLERWLDITLVNGRRVTAVAYVIDRTHAQYAGDLDRETQAEIIAGAIGGRGSNAAYLASTAAHLRELGLPDPDLDWLDARVAALQRS